MPVSVRMVPGAYDAYFAAMATAAAALIGLLFVAVSVRDDTIFGPRAMPGGEALAVTAFIGLVSSFACRTDLRIMWRPLLVIRVSRLVSRAADHR